MTKVDFKRERKELYRPSTKEVSLVEVPAMNFLMIDGEGDPGKGGEFELAIEALYPLAYSLKFMSKQSESGQDYVVPPMEGLWWADDMSAFLEQRRDEWKWTLMIMQPDFIRDEMVESAFETVRKKKRPEFLDRVRFESFDEGTSVQIMHIGPYSEEGPNIQRLHAKIDELGKTHNHKHHEIYLSDPRRAAPEKLKTVLRQSYC
ncbi:GyrI-like domain-containing protein [Pelagicoccus mobilis]|uniref:GyrI-like domain-containing protein n=1 Tax=Pelagicoccus mobilis TaxID=415221 RepID=A0A934VPJ0_9BACT|nr:GyrI-like domain-containing protein [Pelagicoccus mobilis]MBK1877342.1 GyrI-like domain-containing protein [Pelagicoccus mobilis]